MIHLRNVWIVPTTLILALMLHMLPLPVWIHPYRPDWVILVCIYWAMAIPSAFGLGWAFVVGVFVDVSNAVLLGQHAFIYSLVVFIVVVEHKRLRLAPMLHQAFAIAILLFASRVVLLVINSAINQYPTNLATYFAPILSGAIIWPVIHTILRDLQLRYRLDS